MTLKALRSHASMPTMLKARRGVLHMLGVHGDVLSRHASRRCDPCMLSLQVALPPSLQLATDEQKASRLRAWITSFAAFLKTQPASQEVDLADLASSSVKAARPLAPFITGLDVILSKRDDLSMWLSYLCQVMLPSAPACRDLSWHHSPSPPSLPLTVLSPAEGPQAALQDNQGRAAALLSLQDPC
jgi:hypothetical protein